MSTCHGMSDATWAIEDSVTLVTRDPNTHELSMDRARPSVLSGGYPVTVYWIVAKNVVAGVVSAGTATTIWLPA
jgi:hypothetical protein